MNRGSVKEYMEARRGRYLKADRKEKGRILDEAMEVTGHHRKALVRAVGPRSDGDRDQRRGRPRQYGHETAAVLKTAWEAGDRMRGKRLQPFLGELTEALERHGEMTLAEGVRERLQRMSAATIDRLLKPHR